MGAQHAKFRAVLSEIRTGARSPSYCLKRTHAAGPHVDHRLAEMSHRFATANASCAGVAAEPAFRNACRLSDHSGHQSISDYRAVLGIVSLEMDDRASRGFASFSELLDGGGFDNLYSGILHKGGDGR